MHSLIDKLLHPENSLATLLIEQPMEKSGSYNEQTTGDLLETLDSDYRRCYSQVLMRLEEGERSEDGCISADYEFDARQLIRAAFAYIEGAIYLLKIEALFNFEENGIELSPQQSHFIFEANFDLNDKGEIVQRPAKIPLTKNIRFAFRIFAEANGIESCFDPTAEWWPLLQDSIRVRDRLMHPRLPSDLDVTPKETITMVKAKAGFDELLHVLLAARNL